MRLISDRDLRNTPGKVREALAQGDVVVTSRGKPYALMLPITDPDRLDEALLLASRLRAQLALSRIRAKAATGGMDRMSMEDIDAEIRAERRERKARTP